MITDIITVTGTDEALASALEQAEKFAAYKELDPRDTLHLRLLTEEMMGMMRSITGENTGSFWIEDKDGEFLLHLKVATRMNSEKREKLLSAATTGRNESAKGLMGKLRDFFDRSDDEDMLNVSGSLILSGMYEESDATALGLEWSLMRYEDELAQRIRRDDQEAKEAWDELERSVVAHVADEVKVSIRGWNVEMIIIRKMK